MPSETKIWVCDGAVEDGSFPADKESNIQEFNMKVPKRTSSEDTTENFVNALFAIVTVVVLSSVFWADEHDVYGYYQNLLIASFSVAITIIHICNEIRYNKACDLSPPQYISTAYALCKIFMLFCCVIPICFCTMLNKNAFLSKHMLCNEYWGICLITFIPIVYAVIWGYIYPLIFDIPYGPPVRIEQRPK